MREIYNPRSNIQLAQWDKKGNDAKKVSDRLPVYYNDRKRVKNPKIEKGLFSRIVVPATLTTALFMGGLTAIDSVVAKQLNTPTISTDPTSSVVVTAAAPTDLYCDVYGMRIYDNGTVKFYRTDSGETVYLPEHTDLEWIEIAAQRYGFNYDELLKDKDNQPIVIDAPGQEEHFTMYIERDGNVYYIDKYNGEKCYYINDLSAEEMIKRASERDGIPYPIYINNSKSQEKTI